MGVEANTAKVLLQRVALGPQQVHIQRAQLIDRSTGKHAIARAVDSRRIYMPLPIEVEGGVTLLAIDPSEDRWLDEHWEAQSDAVDKEFLKEQLPIASAVVHHDEARLIVVGSGGWLLSWAADRASQLGDGQLAMANPGNTEFLLASIEWLAGLDDWIAASPISQHTSRIVGLTATMYRVWLVVLILGVPSMVLGIAVILSMRRRVA